MKRRGAVTMLDRLVGAGSRNFWHVVLFLVGSMALGVMGSALFGLLTRWRGDSTTVLLLLFASAGIGLFVIAVILSALIEVRRQGTELEPNESAAFEPHRGLVVLVSPGQGRSSQRSIERHLGRAGKPGVEHCWLLYTAQSKPEADELADRFGGRGAAFTPVPVRDFASIHSAFHAVESAISQAMAEGLGRDDVIVDVTGGTKMMTAGATLACADRRVAIQYMKGKYDAGGRLVPDVDPIPIKVVLAEVLGQPADEPEADAAAETPRSGDPGAG